MSDRYLPSLPDDSSTCCAAPALPHGAEGGRGGQCRGIRCWILLLVGEHDSMDDLVLQITEAVPSALEP